MDCSVGTIVWVRRRNGSWWPGRILAQHELLASHLMSPRSGTPVKLLGREDASVDWYNLEKSKRVKAFRCGEFDACIERAEASQGVPIKKREKYARREDAILHALELEKEQLEKKRQKLGTNCNNLGYKHSSAPKKELNSHSASELHLTSAECMGHDKAANLKPHSHSMMLSDEVNGSSPINAQKNRSGCQTNWEDDNTEAIPRMRGLKDFGLRIARSKRKASNSLVFERKKNSFMDNHADIFPDSRHSMGSVNSDGPGKSSSAIKRKRSHSGLVEESLVKRRDRRRPLVQVLKSSAQLPAFQSLQTNCESASILAQEEKEQGAICRAKRSRCIYLPADSSDCLDHTGYSSDQMQISQTQFVYTDGLHRLGSLAGEDTSSGLNRGDFTYVSEGDCMGTDVEEETTVLQGDKWLESKNSERRIRDDVSALEDQEMFGKISNDFEASLSDCNTHIHSNDEAAGAADMGVSKWHMKGKRNIRNITKRTTEFLDGKGSVMPSDNCNGSLTAVYDKKQSIFKTCRERVSRQGFYHKDGELNYAYVDDFFEKDFDNKLLGIGKQQYPLMLKPSSRDHAIGGTSYSDEDSHEMFPSGWEADEPLYLDRKAYWEESDDGFDPLFVRPFNSEMNSPLIDVDLKVQASYQGERVPLVSLMSKLNGKAIIGHPVHIEILRDGYTNLLFPRNGFGVETTVADEHSAPPAVWRTGRRTAMQRVPRADLAPSTFEGDGGELDLCSEAKSLFKEPYTAPLLAGSVKKSSHRCHLTTGKSHKKLLKKGSLSSQKTRTLSSIVTEHKHTGTNASAKHRRKDCTMFGGLIKPGSVLPLVACVPVKVVFSRILEAVGRLPSTGTAHQDLLTGLAERNPL